MKDFVLHKMEEKGAGLPFGIISNTNYLFQNKELFSPSLRDFHVIFWLKKGSGYYYIDFKKYEFKPNTIILISKDQYHYFDPPKVDWEFVSIPFKEEFIYRTDNDLRHLFHFSIGQHFEGQQVLKLSQTDALQIERITLEMEKVLKEWSGETREKAFYHLLCYLLISCEGIQTPEALFKVEAGREGTNLLLDFNRLLEKHFRRKQKVTFYVEQLVTSFKTLSSLTAQHYKLSPKQVIIERVVLEMKRQLKGTEKSVKEIAYELGFDESTNMVKYFKKHSGLTPSEFKSK